MIRLESFVNGAWKAGKGDGRRFVNPTTGEVLGTVDASGIDTEAAVTYARHTGGAALRKMTFAERAALLRGVSDVLAANRPRYNEIATRNSGNTQSDATIDIEGGIGTLKVYSRLGDRLGATQMLIEPGSDQLAKEDVFRAAHIWTTRPGVAIHINAFNFPSWGLWEKFAVAVLAGVPVVAKPASPTAWLSHEMVRDVCAANVLPAGVLSLICGTGEGLLDSVTAMDHVAFTGSHETASHLRRHPRVLETSPRLNIEADSINATILGPDVTSGQEIDALFRREIVRALSVKAGQMCTNIRRILVPQARANEIVEALAAELATLKTGNPGDAEVRVGPLVHAQARDEAVDRIAALAREAKAAAGGGIPAEVSDADPKRGAFLAPTLLVARDADHLQAVHEIEVFGPAATVIAYRDLDHAIALALAGGGSLVASLFSDDPQVGHKVVPDVANAHGRVMAIDSTVGKAHTGHAIVMPQCVHGGPGRAGGGEELGGLRGLRFYMQRTAIQGSPGFLNSLRGTAADAAL